jgi:hypothetical protein
MKNFGDTIGNRTRELPACSPVPETTAPLLDLLYQMSLNLTTHGVPVWSIKVK